MSPLDELLSLVPPRDPPPPPVDWDAARAALGVDYPADYKALVEAYGSSSIGHLTIFVPGHPNRFRDQLWQVEHQRWAMRYLIEAGDEPPYDPAELLPWGKDDGGNIVWWWMKEGWPALANDARGDEWDRCDEGAVAMLVGLVSGRLKSRFMTVGGTDFRAYDYEPDEDDSSSERPG
jgi:hypothetical protein